MKEIRGDMFAYLGRLKFRLFITTNGFIKNDGTAVMGRGNAAQAVKVFKEEYDLDLPKLLGDSLKLNGNKIVRLHTQLWTFPVKQNWFDRARRSIIKRSVNELKQIIKEDTGDHVYVLPRPGCGNGRLKWEKVKPFLEDLPDNVWIVTTWSDPEWKKN